MSGLPPAHWKNLFHLELVKERNKPKEAPQKPPQAPFFLQFRAGESVLGDEGDIGAASGESKGASDGKEMEGWDAVWSDNDEARREDGGEFGDRCLPRIPSASSRTEQDRRHYLEGYDDVPRSPQEFLPGVERSHRRRVVSVVV